MSELTMFDARNTATVRRALDDALMRGTRVVMFGSIRALIARDGAWTVGRWSLGWTSEPMRGLTTDQAVAAIVALATTTDKD